VVPPTRHGFGSTLIERTVSHELNGLVAFDYRPEGLTVTLSFPFAAQGPTSTARPSVAPA
jgi:two-component sensor histidine kinase